MAKITSQSIAESSTPTQDDEILKKLHEEYEQALRKHNGAKARLAQLPAKDAQQGEAIGTIGRSSGVAALRQRHLESHLENLRLQQRYRNLRLLSQYTEQADQIASDEGIFDAQEPGPRAVATTDESEQQAGLAVTQHHLEALRKDARARTTELEIALVKARQQLKTEHILLENARTQLKASRNATVPSEAGAAKQRAMEATRDELQNWIAESLARCEQEISQPTMNTAATHAVEREKSEQDVDTAIDNEYEQYLEGRLRLVHGVEALRTLLIDSDHGLIPKTTSISSIEPKSSTEDQKQRLPMQRAPHLRHKSRMSIHKLAEQTSGPGLTKIESRYLPKYHHERLLNTHTTYLDGQTTTQDGRLLQGLGLLSHESHLLPSYPLSHMDSVGKDHLKELSQQQKDVEHLLGAWGFASDTAEEVLKEGVLGNVEETKEALERARQYLKEIQIMEAMRKEVATGQTVPSVVRE